MQSTTSRLGSTSLPTKPALSHDGMAFSKTRYTRPGAGANLRPDLKPDFDAGANEQRSESFSTLLSGDENRRTQNSARVMTRRNVGNLATKSA